MCTVTVTACRKHPMVTISYHTVTVTSQCHICPVICNDLTICHTLLICLYCLVWLPYRSAVEGSGFHGWIQSLVHQTADLYRLTGCHPGCLILLSLAALQASSYCHQSEATVQVALILPWVVIQALHTGLSHGGGPGTSPSVTSVTNLSSWSMLLTSIKLMWWL